MVHNRQTTSRFPGGVPHPGERSSSVQLLEQELAEVEAHLERNRAEQDKAAVDAETWRSLAAGGTSRPRNLINGTGTAVQHVHVPVLPPHATPMSQAPRPMAVPIMQEYPDMPGPQHDGRRSSGSSNSSVSQQQYQNMLKANKRSQDLVAEQSARLVDVQDRLKRLEVHPGATNRGGSTTPSIESVAPHITPAVVQSAPHPLPQVHTMREAKSDMVPRKEVEGMMESLRAELLAGQRQQQQQQQPQSQSQPQLPAQTPSQQQPQQLPREPTFALAEQLRGVAREVADLKASTNDADTSLGSLDLERDLVSDQRKQVQVEIADLEKDMVAQLQGMLAKGPCVQQVVPQVVSPVVMPREETQEPRRVSPERREVRTAHRTKKSSCRGHDDDAVFEECENCSARCSRCHRRPLSPMVQTVRTVVRPHAPPLGGSRLSPTRSGALQNIQKRARVVSTPYDMEPPPAVLPRPVHVSMSPEVVPDYFQARVSPPRPQEVGGSGGGVNAFNDQGVTPLLAACHNGDDAAVRALLSRGADPEVADADGWTALHISSQKGHCNCVKVLLDAGCNVNARDCDGSTPLMIAALESHTDVVRTLLVVGANVEVRDDDGTTALMVAAQAASERCLALLLRNGADPLARDSSGRTALHFSQAINASKQCIKILSKAEQLAGGSGNSSTQDTLVLASLRHARSLSAARTSPPPPSHPGSVAGGERGYYEGVRDGRGRVSPPPRQPHQNLSFAF